MNISLRTLMLITTLIVLTGCAAVVPMAPKEQDAASKAFKAPPSNMAGVYIYRNSFLGQGLRLTLKIDNVIIGETSNGVYFHREITPGEHTLATEAEFGDNILKFNAEAGKNYFFQQYPSFGAFRPNSHIQAVSEEEGKKAIQQCNEAM